MLITATVSC